MCEICGEKCICKCERLTLLQEIIVPDFEEFIKARIFYCGECGHKFVLRVKFEEYEY